jgi:hypothetical protein
VVEASSINLNFGASAAGANYRETLFLKDKELYTFDG